MTWWFGGGGTKNPDFISVASARAREKHRKLSTATAAVLHVVRRSRLRRFPRGTKDHAFEGYYELVQRTLVANAQMLLYGTRNPSEFDILLLTRTKERVVSGWLTFYDGSPENC